MDKYNKSAMNDIKKLHKSQADLVNTNNNMIGGNDEVRDAEVTKILNDVRNLVTSDTITTRSNKPVGTSSYEYIVNTMTGGAKKDKDGNKQPPNINQKNAFENIFSKDSNVAAMFLNSNSSYVTICDEIESVCGFMYQLNDAIDIIRDNVVACEQVNSDVSLEFTFGSATEEDDSKSAESTIRNVGKKYKLTNKIRDHIVPNTVRYGNYYVLTLPYSEIMQMVARGAGVREAAEQTTALESVIDGGKLKELQFENDDVMNPIVETIVDNLGRVSVCENTVGSHIPTSLVSFSDSTSKIFKDIVKRNGKDNKSNNANIEDGLLRDAVKDIDNLTDIPGCHIELVDPRKIVPVKILDHIIGYYYFDNYDYTQMGSSITDIMSNRINHNDRNMIIDNVVNNLLGTLTYGDLLKGNNDFRSLVLNSLLYKERVDNPIRVRFIPPQYVTHFKTNVDENGEGRPVLLRSLFYARLYTTLLLFNFSTILTKSTDTEFYYLNESAISAKYTNRISEFQEQLQMSSIDPTQIINGDVLHGNSAIVKRHFLPKGANGEKLFDMEVVSGQNVDVQNDFMQELKNSAISSTGVPAVMVDYTNEIEYARMFASANIKHLRACIGIQADINDSITELYRKVAQYEGVTSVGPEMLDVMEIRLKKPKVIQNNLSADSVGSVINTVEQMIDIYIGGRANGLSPKQEILKEEMIRRIVMDRTPDLPWDLLTSLGDELDIQVEIRDLLNKISNENSEE